MITIDTVGIFLERMGVPAQSFTIGGEADNRWCLLEEDGSWKVFWSERGTRFDEVTLADEEAACYLLLGRMAQRQLMQGVLQYVPPGA
ncbi:hypothetical protein Lesp02_28680 [Lentzea sp. NBRC 105346]|uniref:hypothetical protein n=1 Tax=Lentzea sp. NBRC 105346 TaxID=3032205 RepID=UPI0025563A2F|nr:hypothetical protein [Lentzea sp. NBRC 105346]GLZ30679.1 hypothetical protein Lesp02_28680 [Lentzea sp. NBRC 105346]